MIDQQRLIRYAAQVGVELSAPAAEKCAVYAARLVEWNQKMNLTAITDPEGMLIKHYLDSLTAVPCLPAGAKTLIDVGTGAGFPGMVLRILEPDFDLTLLDSLGKRVDWLRETCDDMGLSRVTCVHARAEEFAGEHRQAYDMATSRAVAALPLLSELALPLVKVGGCFLAMKSVDSDAEIDSARGAIGQLGGKIEAIRDYTIPGTDVTHRVVIIRKVKDTPPQFPRSWARMKKAPLK